MVYTGIPEELGACVKMQRGPAQALGGLKKGPNGPNLWQILAHQPPCPELAATSHDSLVIKPGAGKASHSVLEDSWATEDLSSRRSHAIWGRSRVRDGKSERPEEAEVNLNIKQHRDSY